MEPRNDGRQRKPGAPGSAAGNSNSGPALVPRAAARRFCVQQHDATRLHYDLRLEMGGVLKSWAVPKGPTLDPEVRRLAVQTEDHPVEYLTFEGVLPKGTRGAGPVVLWDLGTWRVEGDRPPLQEIDRGRLKFHLEGKKLRGVFTLVRMAHGDEEGNRWVLTKARDEEAVFGDAAELHPGSVLRPGEAPPPVEETPPAARVLQLPPAPPRRRPVAPETAEGAAMLAGLSGAVARQRFPNPDWMTPVLRSGPFSAPGWLFEVLWEGWRARLILDRGRTRLVAGNGSDVTRWFPELVGLEARLAAAGVSGGRALLEGQIVAFKDGGHGSLRRLQERIGASPTEIESAAARMPATLVAFDLLFLNGYNLLRVPLAERKRLLRRLVPESLSERLRYSDDLPTEGKQFFELARRRGWPGLVARRADSRYEGGRSEAWQKIYAQPRQAMAIVGYTLVRPGDRMGSLLAAVYHPERRRYEVAALISAGVDAPTRRLLGSRLTPLRKPAAHAEGLRAGQPVQWVSPELVAEVGFAGWGPRGRVTRPVLLGLNPGKRVQDCQPEQALEPAAS